MATIQELIISMRNTTHDLAKKDMLLKENQRKELFIACEQLRAEIETPIEVVARLVFTPHQATAVRIAMEMGIFNIINNLETAETTVAALAKETGADPLLITRIMRVLTSMNIFRETREATFAQTSNASALIDNSLPADLLILYYDVIAQTLVKLPQYLIKNGFTNPDSSTASPFQFAFATKLGHFEWLKSQPKQLRAFNSVMTALQDSSWGQPWIDYFPVVEKFHISGMTDQNRPLLVDVGGGLGHVLKAFRQKFPEVSGKLILQDLHETVRGIKTCNLGENIEVMEYDFFKPQPIIGAKAYHLRAILHDWPHKEARVILENIRAAMSGDSVLLINDHVLPNSGVQLFAAQLDLTMMAQFASMERTQKQWEALLKSAGLEILKIWTPAENIGSACLIEAAISRPMVN